MSIFDDLGHVAHEAWDHGKSTVESFGGAAYAPAGLVWDVATSPSDFKDDIFRAIGRATDPLTSTDTFTGAALAPVLRLGAEAYREGVSEPISTADTVFGHALHDRNPLEMLDTSNWSQAYQVAQHRSIGQSWLLGARQGLGILGIADAGEDPLDPKSWTDVHESHPFYTGTLSGGVDAAASWYMDPLVLAGKGVKIARIAGTRPITAADRLTGIKTLAETERTRRLGLALPQAGLKPRFDVLTGTLDDVRHTPGWLDGKDAVDIQAGLKELDSTPNGLQIAGLLADTDKIPNVAQKINARKQILLTMAGDYETAGGLQDELGYITDALGNIAKGSVTGHQANTIYDSVADILADRGFNSLIPSASKAENVAEAERQIENLPDLQTFLSGTESYYRRLLGQENSLDSIPLPTAGGVRRIGRGENKGLLRSGEANTGSAVADDVLNRTLGRPLQSFYQMSSSHMPLQVMHGLTVKTLQAGPKFTDSFRNIRPEFVVNMNDLEDVTKNVDAYARRAGVSLEARRSYMNRLAVTTQPIERARIVQEVEHQAKKSLLLKHGVTDVSDKDLDGFTRDIMRRFNHRRNATVTSLSGRAFSATKVAENSPRVQKLRAIARERGTEDQFQWNNWRVDQFMENGSPVYLPFLDTQDVSLLPMMPLDEVDRALSRHKSVFQAAFRTWKEDQHSSGALADAKRVTGEIGSFGYDAGSRLWDGMIDTLDTVNRFWKFSALFRLGYPLRIIADDHSRILAAHGAHTLMLGLGAGTKHSLENGLRPFGNRWLATELRAERQVLEDHIGSPDLLARNQEAWGEIADITKKLNTVKSARRSGELKARLQILKEFNPEDLSHAVARRDEIAKILESKSYKVDKAELGRKGGWTNIAGQDVYLPGALQGDLGDIYRQANSGMGGWERTFGRTEGSIAKNLSNSGSFRTITPQEDEAAHLEAWAYAVNYHLRNSELASILIKPRVGRDLSPGFGATTDFVRFLERQIKALDKPGVAGEDFERLRALNGLHSHIFAKIGQGGREHVIGDELRKNLAGIDLRKLVANPKGALPGVGTERWADFLEEFRKTGTSYATRKDVEAFLRTARGRELIRRTPHQGADPERWAADIERMVDEYLPNDNIRRLAAERQLTSRDLSAEFQDINARPVVHGGNLDLATGNGPYSSKMNTMLNRFYKWVGTRNDVMSRHPLFVSLYNDEIARQAEHRIMLARSRGEQLTHSDLDAAVRAARDHAKKGVNRVLFELGGTPEIAHFMRFASPFMAPWMEGLNRWWRIASKDPSVVRRFFMVFDAPRAAGLEVDQNGNPVPKGAPIQDGHYILFQLPHALGGPDPKTDQSRIKFSETSFNMILQGGGLFNPGFGPLVQMPVNAYAVRHPEDRQLQKSIKGILPFGTTSDTLGMWTPSVVDAGWTVASAKFFNHHSRQYTQMQNMLWRDKLIQFELDHHNHPPTQTQANDLFTEAGNEVSSVAGLKFLSASLSPAALQIQSKFTAQMQAYYRLEQQGLRQGKPWDWAQNEFIKQWGPAYFPLVRSSSFNESGVSSTIGTVASLKKNKALLDRVDPSMYRMIVSGEGEGAYSQTARNWLYITPQRSGSTQTFIEQDDPRRAMQDTLTSQGWYDYSAFVNRLNVRAKAMGLNSYLDSWRLQLAKKKGLSKLAEQNPAWWQDYNSFSPVEYDAKLADMQTIANDPTLNADPSRTDVKALQQYLQLRSWATNVLGQRAAMGGSSSPDALGNRDVLSVFTQQVSRLAESNLWFGDYMYNGYIERDPYILDQSEIVPTQRSLAAA